MNFFKDFFSDYGKKIGGSFVGGFLGFGKSGNDNLSKYNTSVGYTGGANYEKLSNLSPKGMGVPTSRFQFLKDIRDFSQPYLDTAKKYYGIAEKYALKPIAKVYDFLPEQVQEDLKRSLTGKETFDDDYYKSLKEIGSKYRGARVDLSGSGGSRAFTAGRVGGGSPVNRAQQAYGQNSLAFRLMEKAAGNGRINTQIAKNYNISGGRQTIALGNVGNIRPFRGKTKLT